MESAVSYHLTDIIHQLKSLTFIDWWFYSNVYSSVPEDE